MICLKCETEKPQEEFYACNKSRCKECIRVQARQYRADHLEYVRAYDRDRGLIPERKVAVAKRARKYVGKYEPFKDRYPEKRQAHNAVNNAIREGRLSPQPCERCAYGIGVQAHHEDYSKPMDVIWLCTPCHGRRHREINEERRRRAA